MPPKLLKMAVFQPNFISRKIYISGRKIVKFPPLCIGKSLLHFFSPKIPWNQESEIFHFTPIMISRKKMYVNNFPIYFFQEPSTLGWIFEKLVLAMILYFVLSIINSLAQSYHKRLHKKKSSSKEHWVEKIWFRSVFLGKIILVIDFNCAKVDY